MNTFYFCTVCGLSLYEILAEKLSLGNTAYPILEPHFVPGLFFFAFFPRLILTGDFDKPGPWFLHTLETQTRRRECIRAAKRWTRRCTTAMDGQRGLQ